MKLVRINKNCYLDTLDTFTEQLVVAVISLIILLLTKTINSRLTQKLPRILIASKVLVLEAMKRGRVFLLSPLDIAEASGGS